MRIALVSCSQVWAGEADDLPLQLALEQAGAEVSKPAWDDPTVEWAGFDGCLLRTTWDYHERRDEFLTWARRVAEDSRLFNPLAVIEWNTIKTYLRELESAGLPVAPTVWFDRGSTVDLATALRGRDWSRGFLKPDVGACAFQTLPFSMDPAGIAQAQTHLDRQLPNAGFLAQPFLESVGEVGEYSVIFIDGEITHTVCKKPVAGDYRVMDEFGATDSVVELPAEDLILARRVCEEFTRRFDLSQALLYARVDFLRDASGSLVINELELVEPSLFFRHCPAAAARLANSLVERLADSTV